MGISNHILQIKYCAPINHFTVLQHYFTGHSMHGIRFEQILLPVEAFLSLSQRFLHWTLLTANMM